MLEVRNIEGVLRVSRKYRFDDEVDPFVPPYGPCGRGPGDVVIEGEVDALHDA